MTAPVRALARFVHRTGRLKATPRAGWLHRGVDPGEVESVADHSFRVALLAWLASAETAGLDRDRAIRLALLHDLAETVVGDLTPYDPDALAALPPGERRAALNQRQIASPERRRTKRNAENAAIASLTTGLSPDLQSEIAALWAELQERSTPEARFVKELDILETWLQSREYLAVDSELPMQSFDAEAAEAIKTPFLQALRDAAEEEIRVSRSDQAKERS
jgi:putative hydrolase of HD superfamily